MFRLKDRRGFFLAEETLKMVLALIGIAVLIYFLTSLYLADKDSDDLEFAQASLEHLTEQVGLKIEEVEIYNPDGWVILTWPRNIERGPLGGAVAEGMPKSCFNLNWENCICICKDKYFSDLDKDCDKMGYCLENRDEFSIGGSGIEIEEPSIKLNIDYESKLISRVG